MKLGTPIAGVQPTSPPEWHDLTEAMKVLKPRRRVVKKDWRSEVASKNGSWILYWDLNDDDEQIIGLGLIEHTKDEKRVRKGQLVSIRPFHRPRTTALIAMIIGTIYIKESERHLWAPVDQMATENVGGFLRQSPWWIITSDPDTGAPVTVFNPSRWRAELARNETGLSGDADRALSRA